MKGMKKEVTTLPKRSVDDDMSEGFTCNDGSKDERVGTVNSPNLAQEKKVVTRHANTEACIGKDRSRCWRMRRM